MQQNGIIDLYLKSHMPEIWSVVQDPKLLNWQKDEMAQCAPDPSSGGVWRQDYGQTKLPKLPL